ncbi:MAG: hypothetical protein O8C66_03370 [Candidatus Methanoperedens sp.]|nr:hypothetical protein [Candidatus Methanoperedens sp.]MCZ7369527.1 hypothetical protein [Candidatus Methanoperedens sp.]
MKKTILFFLLIVLLINNASAYTFTNIGGDFKVVYPTGWNYIEEPDGSDQTFSSQTGRAWVKVVVVPSEGMSFDEIVGDRIRYLNSLGVYPFSENYVAINGVTGKELMFYEEYQQKEYKERQVLILSGNNYFVITGGSLTSDYPFFSDDLDKITNSFTLIKPATGTAPTPTPIETVKELSASVSLHREKINVVVGEDVLLRLSVVNLITKPVMNVQVIIKPPSGMSVASTEFTQGAAGQYTSTYKLEPGATRDIEVRLKPNEIGDFVVEGWVVYYFGDDIKTKKEEILKEPITVRSAGEITSTITPNDGGTSDGSSIILGLIAIFAMIFMAYVIFNKVYKTFKNISGKAKTPTAVEVGASEVDDSLPPHIEEGYKEEQVKINPKIEKESAFEAEKRKQHSLLPPENLDIDTRNYLSFGLNTAISMLDAEIAKPENDALQMQGAIKKDENLLGNLGSRLVNKEISDQTYNDLKNKYMKKISELKSKVMNLESDSAKLKKIRSFLHEKGKYYE